MDEQVAWLSLAILAGLTACAPAAPPAEPPAEVEAGALIYSGNCVACHQEDGHGVPGVYPSLAGSPVVLGDARQFGLWVAKGIRPASLPAGRYPTAMRQFGWMKARDAAALLTYVRSHFGNAAPAADEGAMREVLDQ